MDVIDRPVLAGAAAVPARAFDQFVRTGATVELKAFTGVTGDAGGYAVPREIDGEIDRLLTAISPIRRIANVVKVGSAGYRKLVTTGGTPSGWAAETDARPGTATPVFQEIAPPSGELYAKGRPSTTSYSYSASFAVLLSGRRIAGVGRIWADGQLLRGAAGDWKAETGFRLHLGMEDQAVDPLIASAEGAGLTPAHRGCAYAVFEGLQLATFGNRIPSLSFEVIADAGPVGVGRIAQALAPAVTGTPALALDGYLAGGGSVRETLAGLATASGAWFAPTADGLTMRDAAGTVTAVAADPARDGREVAAADRVATEISVRYFDPARDWQAGLQRAKRPGRGPVQALDLPAALAAGAAKGVAEAVLARGEADRTRRTLGVGLAALTLVPGDAVTIAGEAGTWRVEAVALEAPATTRGAGLATTLTLVPLTPAPAAAAASTGRALPAADQAIGATLLRIAELPALDDTLATQPRLTVMATGTGAGWRQAALLLSLDGGASWTEAGGTAAPAVMGVVEIVPGRGRAMLVERHTAVVVRLARSDMTLADATPARLDAGANLALVGGELLQFGRAEPLGDGRWRLTELWRGRRAMAGAIAVGDRFALVDSDSARVIDLPLATLASEVRVMASGVGDAMPVVAATTVTGVSVAPPAPVGLHRDGATVRWTRRSRAGWRWLDRVDAPLGEEREEYRVTIASGDGAREMLVDTPLVVLASGELAAGTRIEVRQRGTLAESASATLDI